MSAKSATEPVCCSKHGNDDHSEGNKSQWMGAAVGGLVLGLALGVAAARFLPLSGALQRSAQVAGDENWVWKAASSQKCVNMEEVNKQYLELPYPPRDPKDENRRVVSDPNNTPSAINHFIYGGQKKFVKAGPNVKNKFRILVAGGGTAPYPPHTLSVDTQATPPSCTRCRFATATLQWKSCIWTSPTRPAALRRPVQPTTASPPSLSAVPPSWTFLTCRIWATSTLSTAWACCIIWLVLCKGLRSWSRCSSLMAAC
eukprot:m.118787 g.118787  ORF g.118787 m.118787 type:complete len:257 (-) comp19522_c0_seq2:913-1683(-)